MPYAPTIEPTDFVDEIDNAYMPLTPGTILTYSESLNLKSTRDYRVVTHETKEIMGVTTTVVRDQFYVKGIQVEAGLDWYAQDLDGNVWHFGRASRHIKHGRVVSREGSWQAGVDGAQPGIVMPGKPEVGQVYRRELSEGEAEGTARVLRLDASATAHEQSFSDVLQTEDRDPLRPFKVEHRFYAPGVGMILERHMRGSEEEKELVRVRHLHPPRFTSIEEAVAFLDRKMHLPVVLPEKLPRGARLSIYDPIEVGGSFGRRSASIRLDFGIDGYLTINYGLTGFDGCGADDSEPLDVLDRRGLIVEHLGGGATLIWPVPEGSFEGRYGLDSNTLGRERLLKMAESMERARAETKKEAFPGC